MLVSMITVLLFAVGIVGLLLYPKTEGKLNGVKIAVMGTMAVFCYLAFCAAVYNKIGIPVGLPSACISLILMNVLLWGGILRKRKIQRLYFRWTDLICLFLLGAFVIWIAVHVFTPELKPQYRNIDAANHFYYANIIVQMGRLPAKIYFSAYVDAFFILLLKPMLVPALYFKAFILADIVMHVLEVWMFYYLVLTISDKKIMRVMAPIFSVGYFWGYPAYSFMEGHFVYWSNGVMILIFILYALLLVEKYKNLRRYSIPLLLLGAYANLCCNKLFVPVNTLAILAVLSIVMLEKHWERINKKWLVTGIVTGVIGLALAGGAILFLWQDKLAGILADLIKPGGIYSSLYADVIFFVPALFYVLWHLLRHRDYRKTIPVTSVCMLAVTLGMYLLVQQHVLSGYYYYKIYYNLWLCGWLLAAAALEIMEERRQLAWYFSYAGMIGLICVIGLTDYDAKIAEVHEDYNGEYATTQMFSLYRYNCNNLSIDYEKYRISDKVLDVFNYAMQQMTGTDVRIATQDVDLMAWHDGMDLSHAKGFDFRDYELTELLQELDENGVQAIIVQRKDEKYQAYRGYFEQCIELYGNEDAAIIVPSGEKWLEVPEAVIQYEESRLNLYEYVGAHYAGKEIPLMADQSAFFDYMLYYLETGNVSAEVYPWNQVTAEDVEKLSDEDAAWITAQKTIGNLKEQEISYIVVLNGDAYYEKVKGYMENWEVVYEDEAGKILAVDTEDE